MNFEQIAQRIKDRCKEKGYTIKEMLEYCEYNRNFMYDLKCGKNFSLKTFAKLAEFLDCSRCKEKGYTIKEMLEYCEYNRNFMYDLKCGKNFSLKTFAKLAEFLDCSIDYLIGRTDNPDINK